MITSYNENFQYHSKNKLVVIWQAKAACTIVIKMFFAEEGLLEQASRFSWIHDFREIHSFSTNTKRVKAIHKKKTKYIHFVVNPYRRAVSSYLHALHHKYIGNQVINLNISFSDFIDNLISKKIAPNMHHNSQLFVLHKEKDIEYIKMEEIEKHLPLINTKYGLNYKLQSATHYAETKDTKDKFIGKSLWEDIKDAIPKNYYNFYNKDIREKVEKLYKEDIGVLGYTYEEFINNNKL